MKLRMMKLMALCLVLSLSLSAVAYAATAEPSLPLESNYIKKHHISLQPVGGGRISICYTISSTGSMDQLGVTRIQLYESLDGEDFTLVKTFLSNSYSGMLVEDASTHSSSLSYLGIPGRYYKAYVCFWANKGNGHDQSCAWSSVLRAS